MKSYCSGFLKLNDIIENIANIKVCDEKNFLIFERIFSSNVFNRIIDENILVDIYAFNNDDDVRIFKNVRLEYNNPGVFTMCGFPKKLGFDQYCYSSDKFYKEGDIMMQRFCGEFTSTHKSD